ncbi:hypothetical protein H0H87_008169 [Tephrocybe sp. NHM501043]|nr:hypothetical protein H0H87_008169 [Tephrocybe sp. NHM501043]
MATDTSGSDVSSHTSHRNAIIGGVIGGVVALLVLAFLIFWFRKRIFSRSHHVPGTRTKALINPEEFPPIGPVPVTAGVVEPYSVPYTPDTTSFAASSSGPPTVTSSDGTRSDGSRNRLILQGGSDMTQIYPAEKSPLFKLAHIKEDTPSTSTPDPSSDVASITDGAINERAQRIQGLVNELQQEISASGIMASSTNDITSPPPYEPNNRREPLL